MKEGGWRAFREASKQKATSETAVAELERPIVSHRAFALPSGTPVPQPHETRPDPEPKPSDDEEGGEKDENAADPHDDDGADDEDDTEAAADSEEAADDGPPASRARMRKLIADARALLGREAAPEAQKRLDLGPRFSIGHWSVVAIVPVAAAASLLAVRAGLNPYALCLQWWDVLFGTVFLTACVLFLGLAIWKRPTGAWHPGAPALIVAVAVLPFWAGTNAAFGSGCEEIPSSPMLVPPLPPPINVPSLWLVPMPVPRPMELDVPSQPLPLPSQGDVQIAPPQL